MKTTTPKKRTEPAATAPLNFTLNPEQILVDALAEARTFAEPYGRTKLIAEAMTTAGGVPVTRQMVGRWLKQDSHPSFGSAVLLLAVVQSLQSPSQFAKQVAATGQFILTLLLKPQTTNRTTK